MIIFIDYPYIDYPWNTITINQRANKVEMLCRIGMGITHKCNRVIAFCVIHIKTNWWHPLIWFAIARRNSVAEFSFVMPTDKCVACIFPRTYRTFTLFSVQMKIVFQAKKHICWRIRNKGNEQTITPTTHNLRK